MRFKLIAVVFLLGCMLHETRAQQYPKTLLWRITGNNIKKPSYLFGTFHSSDKRVYHLGDSVYSGISACDGFVMEIDPGDYLDTLFNSLDKEGLDITYRNTIENSLVRRDPGEVILYLKQFDSMYNRMRQYYERLTDRQIARLEKLYYPRQKNNMNTILDLFLFDIAKKQGKKLGGIEDIAGRSLIKDEFGNEINMDDYVRSQKKYIDVEEWMTLVYLAGDLDKINEFSRLSQTKQQLSLMLYNRNKIMAIRMDSLVHIRSTFCAVGAAHLPGDSGVINLLRNRGYTVSPVFSSKKIEPGKMLIERQYQTLLNIADADSNYIVQLPGKTTAVTRITNTLFLKTYKEFANEMMLMHGLYEDGNFTKTADQQLEEIKTSFSRDDVKLFKVSKIARQNLDGYEVNFKNDEGYIRMHIFCNNGKTFMFAAGSKIKDSLQSTRSIGFLNSYQVLLDTKKSESEMTLFVSKEKAFSIAFPEHPKEENIKGNVTYTKEDVTLFSSFDNKKKISYLVMLKEPFEGYFSTLDSSAFVQTFSQLQEGLLETISVQENIMLDGHPALKVKLVGESNNKRQLLYAVLAMRDNRLYSLTARGLATAENESQFNSFLNSFKFLIYTETRFEERIGGTSLFAAKCPSPISILPIKNIEKVKDTGKRQPLRTDYYSFDKNRSMTYSVTAIGMGNYYWTENESSFLKENSEIYFNDSQAINSVYNSDSLLYKRNTFNGKIPSVEFLLKNIITQSYSRLRVMHYADSVIVLNIMGAKDMVTDEKADVFFNSFHFINESYTTSIFNSKSGRLVKDLFSQNKVASTEAENALKSGFRFPPADTEILLGALLNTTYKPNETTSHALLLSDAISSSYNPDVLVFARANYNVLKNKREDLRILILNMLSASGDKDAYQLLQSYLVTDPPAKANYGTMLNNFQRYPQLALSIFPAVMVKIADDEMAPAILRMANMLIDNNKINLHDLSAYETHIFRVSKRILNKCQENYLDVSAQDVNVVLSLLTQIDKKQSKNILKDFLDLNYHPINKTIILEMLEHNKEVPAGMINDYCSTPKYQIELYDEMRKIGKQSSFTGTYASQKSFAEAFTKVYMENEIPENVEKYYDLFTIKDTVVNNAVSRYYIHRVTCRFRYGTKIFTSIIGPFSTNISNISIKEGKETFVLYRKELEKKDVDLLFNQFIAQIK